jgi:uncharacterized protein YaiE (UPF0345 family)
MNKLMVFSALVLGLGLSTFVESKGRGGTVHVSGYTTKSGKYVAPYYRSAPGSGSSSHSSGTGIPCGNSYISASDICHKSSGNGTGTSTGSGTDSGTDIGAVMPTVFETTTPMDYGFLDCSEAFGAGFANIPSSDPSYHKNLDRDDDGIACESSDINYASQSPGLPQEAIKGVNYATIDDLNALGSVGVMADGSYTLSTGDKGLTFIEGVKKTREGLVLEAAPFILDSVLFVPVSSLKLIGCKLTFAKAGASAVCGDQSSADFNITKW